jgi:hypothetical protein
MIEWAPARGDDIRKLSIWVADIIWPGEGKDFGNCQGIAVIEDGNLIAGMIYHNWEPSAGVMEISGAGITKRWLTRQTLRAMFSYPFNECDCQAVVMRVSDHDKPLHRMLMSYGFETYRIPRLRGRNEAENIFVLTDNAWKGNKFNRKEVE